MLVRQGTIVGKDLKGDAPDRAVAEALAKKESALSAGLKIERLSWLLFHLCDAIFQRGNLRFQIFSGALAAKQSGNPVLNPGRAQNENANGH